MPRFLWAFVFALVAGWAEEATFEPARAILAANCVKCHGGEATMAGFDLSTAEGFRKAARGERMLELVREGKMPFRGTRLTAAQVASLEAWVKAGSPWPAGVGLVAKAPAKKVFWAFRAPVKVTPPAVGEAHPIDAFVRAKLREKGLTANARASHRTLIRRLSFDLTGMAPEESDYALSYEQAVEKYLASPHYGERQARHWLDVVRFGETDGGEHNYERFYAWPYRDWVINAFNTDKPYDAFIREQLTGDLIAPQDPQTVAATGFLVAGPWDQVQAEINKDKAMAMTQRMDELDDMVTTTFHTFQALTVNCARCHDHRFDPIPTRDYYRLTGVFQGVGFGTREIASPEEKAAREARVKPLQKELSEARAKLGAIENPVRARLARVKYEAFDRERAGERLRLPLNPLFNRNRFARVEGVRLRLAITGQRGKRSPKIDALVVKPSGFAVANWEGAAQASSDQPVYLDLGNGPAEEITWSTDAKTGAGDGQVLVYRIEAERGGKWETVASSLDHVEGVELDLPAVSEAEIAAELDAPARAARAEWKERIGAIEARLKAIPELPRVYAAKPVTPQKAFVLERGSVSKPGEEVSPGALSALPGELGLTGEATDGDRRRALAKWLTAAENPLTARVIANRIWYFHFGNGIVNTPSDFGVAGDRPSHPELLDWLAVSLQENGWSLKWLHRMIVTSETYKQSAAAQAKGMELDADNRLYWRMPLRRMDAETIRDAVLQAAGNLNTSKRGGPGFFLQKKGDGGSYIYKALDNDGPEVWQRAVYRFVVRGGERLMMDSFDCPDPAVATPQRSVSNTPVQAFTLLNNDFIVRQAGFLARRLEREAGSDAAKQIERAYAILFGRTPSAREREAGLKFIEKQSLALYTRALINTNEFLYVP